MAKGFVRISARDIAAIGVFALLALAAVLRSAVGTQLDAFTVDEPWHIVAGTSYVRNGDFSLNPEHPPLAKLWVGAAMPADFKLRARTKLSERRRSAPGSKRRCSTTTMRVTRSRFRALRCGRCMAF